MVLSGLNIIKTDPGQKQRPQLMFPKTYLDIHPENMSVNSVGRVLNNQF